MIPIDLAPLHLVGLGGAVGAVLRHALSGRVDIEGFPLGTLTVNVLGSFALGIVAFTGVSPAATLVVATGVCGAFTTFSSFAFETVRLWETGEYTRAVVNAGSNLVGSVLAIGLAWLVVHRTI